MMADKMKNEEGFVLITALMMLVILMIIGIAATNTTTVELQITGNDKAAKQTFYQAEAGTQVATQLVDDCVFSSLTDNDVGTVHINNLNLCQNSAVDWSSIDAYLPNSTSATATPRTDLVFGGVTELLAGSAIQMAAGYEGKGKAAGSGGAVRKFDIRSHRIGRNNSNSTVRVEWDSFL